MKNFIYSCLLLSLASILYAQIETELLFDFQLSSDEEIVDIQLFDFTNNGIEDICISTSNDSIWAIYIFETSGELIDTLTYDYTATGFLPRKTHLLTYNNTIYIALLSFILQYSDQMRLDIYNLDNELITSYIKYFPYMFIESLSKISITTDIEQQQLYIIFSFLVEWWDDGPGVDSGGKKSFSIPLIFDGDTLNMLSYNSFLFHNYQRYSNISLFYYYWWYEETRDERESGGYQGISEISLDPDLVEIDTLGCWNYDDDLTPKFIGSDDETYNNYGIVYLKNNTFTCLTPITHEVSWFSDYSHLESSWDITTSANATFNEDDKYLIYFEDNKCEIRDRTNGEIIHFEHLDITPYKSLRNQNGEIIIITQNNNLYQIYKITNIAFLVYSSDDEIETPLYLIFNYPNPFNPTTTIKFSIQDNSKIKLTVYNIKGQEVKTLINDNFEKGKHSIIWNGDDEAGESVSSGIYFYKLNVNGKTEAIKKCLLLK